MTDNTISTTQDIISALATLRAELNDVTNERDWADERCAELERHNANLAEAVQRRTAIIRDMGAENRKLRTRIRLATAVLVILSVLALLYIFARPAAAQDTTVYIPLTTAPHRTWFTPAELTAAMVTAGFDPAIVEEHTWCDPHATSNPPADLRYRYCYQQWLNGAPTDGSSGVLYQMLGDVVTPIYITTIHGAAASGTDDNPGCDANGDCG